MIIRANPEVVRQTIAYEPNDLCRRIGAAPRPAILESLGDAHVDANRWSVYAARPRLVFSAVGDRWRIDAPDRLARTLPRSGQGTLAALESLLGSLGLDGQEPEPGEPAFRGGLIGHFGYDLATLLERVPRRYPRTSRIPDLRFGLYDTYVQLDHKRREAHICGLDLLGEGSSATNQRIDRLLRDLNQRVADPPPNRLARGPQSDFTSDEYFAIVKRGLEYIRAGDIFQVNLSHRFTAEFDQLDPLSLYQGLRQRSPAPFSAYLRWGRQAVASASPESFYETRGRMILTRPIKGTRPRGFSPAEDSILAAELLASAKDRAELTMIIDLERNDLGRVCEYGSVRVSEPYTIESYAQVHHSVATIAGRLREDVGPVDVLRAVFPGGSITGAPKIRAMQIIDELERSRRGLYTGAIGYFSRGASAFNIAIRTVLIEGRTATYQVGGGIVADSDPLAEYEETLHKGRGLRAVIEGDGITPP